MEVVGGKLKYTKFILGSLNAEDRTLHPFSLTKVCPIDRLGVSEIVGNTAAYIF